MPMYISKNTKGDIIAWSKYPEDGYEKIDFDGELVRGWDEKFYKKEEIPPALTLADAQATKRAEINAGFDAALAASLTMPSVNTPPSTVELTVAIGLFNAEDPVGLVDLCAIHEARRASLLAAVDAANSVEAVQSISVSYAV